MIDIVVIALLLISIVIGFRKGMVNKLWGIFSTIFSYGLALLYHGELAQFINTILPQYITIEQEIIRSTVYNIASRIIAFIILFIIIRLILKLVVIVLDGIFSLPILSGINRVVGSVLGLVEMYFLIFLISAFFTFFPQEEIKSLLDQSEIIQAMLIDTPFISEVYNNLHSNLTNPS